MSVTLYKLGGSLLDLPDLSQRLMQVVPADVRPLFVVGGGPTADLVRQWDRIHQLGEERAHWLALRSLQLNESLLAQLLPQALVVSTRAAADAAWCEGQWPIVSAYEFVTSEERRAKSPLPHTWNATSDTVAAWIAAHWPAERLVLLKSTDWKNPQSAIRNPQSIDPCFPTIARDIPRVEWINLRDALPTPCRLPFGKSPSPHETAAPPIR